MQPNSAHSLLLHSNETRTTSPQFTTNSSQSDRVAAIDSRAFAINGRGFTLIEIIVVIILISIASSLVLMNVGQSGRMKQSRIFAGKMVSMCKKARFTAINKGAPVCLTISPDSRECRISLMDGSLPENRNDRGEDKDSSPDSNPFDGGSEQPINENILKIPENILLEGEQIKIDYDGLYSICFYPDGSSGGGILTISVENEFEFTFQVDMLTGSIREVSGA